jgi:hemoglobin/transferrin/lactoferrin receptor protein
LCAAIGLVLAGATFIVHAAPDPAPDPATADARSLERITVTAAALPVAVGDATANVRVIDADEIERRGARDIKDLVRYEPGVSVRNQPGRFGLAGFNIRGLEGNRVLVRIDGVRVADGFAIGSFANAGRDAVDLDTLKQVEILRGPASSLYGSSALGGVVSFVTRDPLDYLVGDDAAAFRLRGGYGSVGDGKFGGYTQAFRSGAFSALAHVTHRQGTEPDNFGRVATRDATRTVNNPQDYRDEALLTKGVLDLDGHGELRATLEGTRGRTDTDVASALGRSALGPSTVLVESLTGIDRARRSRGSVEWRADEPIGMFDGLRLNFYVQDSVTTQDTREDRTTIAPSGVRTPVTRERRFRFEQDLDGVEFVGRHQFRTGAFAHHLVWGAERLSTDTAQLRDGLQRNRNTGVVTNVVIPDVFPVRDFPLSTTTESALFVENEITLADSGLVLVPGLRWDRYELAPQPDPVFAADNPGIVPVAIDADELSPRLGLAWRFTPGLSLHANYAEGFRAPPYNDANIGFTNLQFGYTALPNAELQSETSRGLEVGLRWRGDAGYAALTAYRNRYRDFIESLRSLGVDPAARLLVFQSQNIDAVDIRGVEFRGALRLGALHPRLDSLELNTALATARGRDADSGAPLNSVDPPRGVLGIRHDAVDGRWNAELIASFARRPTRVDDSAGALFRPPGHAVLDLVGQYRASDWLRVDFGVYNLADRRYWEWADVRGRPATDPAIERFTRPGRAIQTTFVIDL